MSKKSLLIVDDHIDAMKGTKIFEKDPFKSFEVSHARDGTEALNILKDNPKFNIVICDINMPGGEDIPDVQTLGGQRTGILVAEYIKKNLPETEVALWTSYKVGDFDTGYLLTKNIPVIPKTLSPGGLFEGLIGFLNSKINKISRLTDAVELKPGAFGVKLDIRKLAHEYARDRKQKAHQKEHKDS